MGPTAADGADIIPSWASHVMGTMFLPWSLYSFPRKLTIFQFQWGCHYTTIVTFANNAEHNIFKP